jgi:single-strand DNA-binding protein
MMSPPLGSADFVPSPGAWVRFGIEPAMLLLQPQSQRSREAARMGQSARSSRAGLDPGTEAARDADPAVNHVRLVGRLPGPATERILPSGTVLLTFRIVVPRTGDQPPRPDGTRAPTVDTVDCVAWQSRIRRAVTGWRAGDVVAVEGALRRRFWRGPTGLASRYEVHVTFGRRVRAGQQ